MLPAHRKNGLIVIGCIALLGLILCVASTMSLDDPHPATLLSSSKGDEKLWNSINPIHSVEKRIAALKEKKKTGLKQPEDASKLFSSWLSPVLGEENNNDYDDLSSPLHASVSTRRHYEYHYYYNDNYHGTTMNQEDDSPVSDFSSEEEEEQQQQQQQQPEEHQNDGLISRWSTRYWPAVNRWRLRHVRGCGFFCFLMSHYIKRVACIHTRIHAHTHAYMPFACMHIHAYTHIY